MESDVTASFQKRLVNLPGGKDKEERPIITISVPPDTNNLEITGAIKYILKVFSEESRRKGFTVILDARKGPWRTVRSCIRQVNASLSNEELAQFLVLRPDAFWDKQRVENCTSTQKDGQVIFVQRSRLFKYVEQSQLPFELGGNFIFNSEQWFENRTKVEEFSSEAITCLQDLEELQEKITNMYTLSPSQIQHNHQLVIDRLDVMNISANNCIEKGRELVQKIEYDNRNRKLASEFESMSTPQDTLDTIDKLETTIGILRKKLIHLENSKKNIKKSYVDTKDLNILSEGIVKVTNWIIGPAEDLLKSRCKVGYDVASAEELRREHENIELQCWDAYGAYAELVHKIDSFAGCEFLTKQQKDLISQKDFMDFVCRSFATRLERRRNILITSLRFFRLVSEYFDKTGEVFDLLVMGSKAGDFVSASKKLKELQDSQSNLDLVETELVKEGEKLSDMLSMPVKDALGREVSTDYSEDIINIKDIMDATTARKNIFSDSVELQKLTLEQVTHVNQYEKDADQAITWLDDLFQVLAKDHSHVGCTVHEIQAQKDDLQIFQETAKCTYNYGLQLLNAASALRQSCKIGVQENQNKSNRLDYFWERFLNVSQEQMTRLRVSAVFHRSVEEQCNQLRDLREAVATIPLMEIRRKRARVRHYFAVREKLLVEVGRMVRLGRLLRSRLREALFFDETMSEKTGSQELSDSLEASENSIAVEAISERLSEVTGLAEELDQTLKSAQQDCSISPTATSLPITIVNSKKYVDDPKESEEACALLKPDDVKSDDEFLTASDCTLQHSRSSSYNTASECEQTLAPWWEYGKDDVREDLSKEKMVLAVGLPELPLPKNVLSPSPEAPPGKIVREVIETTHIKVQQSHTMGVKSFVLSSEMVKDKREEVRHEEVKKIINVAKTKIEDESDEFTKRLKECGDWLQLKILDVTPELTALGDTLNEALELQRAHDEVLRQLQNKQSPVEELLRQADQLIATQKPRAEVYAAMAESLAKAWKDVNLHLELRKLILDLNVQYHTRAQEFFDRMDALESACSDTIVPIEIDAVKSFLNNIHDLRRSVLEALMGALQAGNTIIDKLKELGAEGTLDSRPDRIRISVNRAITQVQGWMDKLHMRRQVLESTFSKRKNQLEQCLALALLAADLKELEENVLRRCEIFNSNDQLGDSSSSAELLQHENKKLLVDARNLQEKAVKITKATDQLVQSGCFAGEQATQQSYFVLSLVSDYLNDLQQRDALYDRVIQFFKAGQMALSKLDDIDIQLRTNTLPMTSPELSQLHAQCANDINDIVEKPLAEGYAILQSTTRNLNTSGVQKMVEDLENKKITLEALCVAHKEENIRINKALMAFLDKQELLCQWLIQIENNFLRDRSGMGDNLPAAKDFLEVHNRLLGDLQTKGNEINTLLLTLPPILEYLNDPQRSDVDAKVESLHERWIRLKNILESRLDLALLYIKFHTEAEKVGKEMDGMEEDIRDKVDISEEAIKKLEEKMENIVPLYQSAKNTGLTFINEARKVKEPHLDTNRACVCVESVLESLAGRQLTVERNWQTFHTEITEKREVEIKTEIAMTESVKTINWVTKLDTQLYPVITTSSTNPSDISSHIENKLKSVLPEIQRAQNEVEERIRAVNELVITSPEKQDVKDLRDKLSGMLEKLSKVSKDYENLLQKMINYFKNLIELDNGIEEFKNEFDKAPIPNNLEEIENLMKDHEESKQEIFKLFRLTQYDCEEIVNIILQQIPPGPARLDIEKLNYLLEQRKIDFENDWVKRHDKFNAYHQLGQFDADLQQINETLEDLSKQLQEVKGQYGESLSASISNSDSFVYFENTIDLLEQQIKAFIVTGEKLLKDQHIHSPHISHHIQNLQDRWDKFKEQVKETRRLINLSINYFELIEEANNWFREGSNLLVSIAKRSTEVKQPEQAVVLLNEIEIFLKPGEIKQSERIKNIAEIEAKLYGPDKMQEVINDNDDLIHSFNAISQELNSLAENLKIAQEQRERAMIEEEEARLKAEEEARRKAEEEERRKIEEEARRKAEEEEAIRRAEEEARRRAEEEARRRAEEEEARRKAHEEAKRKAEEEAIRKAEEEAKRKAEEEAKLKAEEEAKRKAEEEAKRKAEEAKRIAEEEAKRKAEEEVRRRVEEEARLKALEEQRAKFLALEEEARLRTLAEEQARIKALEEEARIKALEEEARIKALEEEARRKSAEEQAKLEQELNAREEEEARLKILQEEARLNALEEARRLKEEEDARVEARRLQAVKAERLRMEEEEQRLMSEIKTKEAFLESIKAEEELIKKETMVTHEPITIIHKFEVESRESPDLGVQIIEVFEDETPKLEPPVFVCPLSDQVIQEGSKFTFICQVTGTPLPIVTWLKDGISIQNNPDYQTTFDQGLCTLSIEETFTEDSAKYTCSAINAAGGAETSATLTVKEIEPEEQLIPPTFIHELEPGLSKEGDSFEFKCRVEGNPLPTVQWYKNVECIDNSPDYTITYNNGEAILRFEKVDLSDKADYTCKAFNDVGIAQSTANLSVSPCEPTEPPAFITPLSNVMARAGQKIKLECEVSGLPPPNLQWSHNGKPVKETRELKLHRDGHKATLIIHEAFPKDAGNYSVTAINPIGEITSTSSVSVKGRVPAETSDSEIASDMEPIKPSIQVHLKDVNINEGNRVRLDCVIVGQPEPEVIWYHDDRPVKESQDFQLLFQGDRCSLVIQEALPEDSGEYKVVALNSAGEASSKALLSVTPIKESEIKKQAEIVLETSVGAPKFTKLLSDILVTEGEKVTLEAAVSGEPKPEIKWLLNNTPLEPSENIKISHDDEGNVKLEMENVKPENRGVYTVKASNIGGDAKCFAQVIVKTLRSEPTKVLEEIKIAPSFKQSFHDRSVFENTPTKFECIVFGKPTPKCRWLFNDNPVSGKNFLISTAGDRQILSMPDVTKQENGKITCVAENDAGTASCSATINVQSVSDITLPEFEKSITDIAIIPTDLTQSLLGTQESTFSFKREINVQSSSSTSSKLITSNGHKEPYIEEHKFSSQDQKSFKQVNMEAPEIKESHKQEEYHKLGDHTPVIHEKSSSLYTVGGKEVEVPQIMPAKETPLPKSIFKARPPKFMTPVIGKIVDQNVDVVLEGILDGQPTPEVSWTKNGSTLKSENNVRITYEHNCARIEIKNVSINDSGKYTCTAVNEAGKAISTADLVVRKTVFPPVFGRRLQAQIIKKGDRVNMEVEVTGTPEPTVTWFKDGTPLDEALKVGYKIKTQGNCHTLVLEKADLSHTGKYMVKANNSGGEAQSIADVAVYEPTPDTMVEVVKTVVFEDIQKHESLISSGDQKVEITTTAIEAAPLKTTPTIIPKPFKPETTESISTEIVTHTENAVKHDTKTITLERTTPVPEIDMPKKYEPTSEILPPDTVEEGIQTSSITKQQSLDFFVHKMKEVQEPRPKEPKEEIKPSPIKQEIFTKFENVAQETKEELLPKTSFESYKPYEADLKKLQTFEPLPKIEPLKIDALPKLEPFPTTQSYSSYSSNQTQMYEEFQLTPEPPAEICYIPKQETIKSKEDLSEKVRRLEEAHRDLRDHEIPSGGVKIFPSPITKHESLKEEKIFSKSSTETKESSLRIESSSIRSTSPKPSLEGIQMEKLWTPKLSELEKSYSETQYYKAETLGPVEKPAPLPEFKSETSSSFQKTQSMQKHYSGVPAVTPVLPEPSIDARTMEKSWAHKHVESVQKDWPPPKQETPIRKQSWSTQSTLEKSWKPIETTIIKETTSQKADMYIPPPLPVPHYLAEVSHSSKVKETIQSHTEHSEMSSQSYISEDRNVKPSEVIKSWPPMQEPVKDSYKPYIETVRPVLVQDITNEIYLEPGTPPEIAYAQPPARKVSYVQTIEQDLEKNLVSTKVPPCAVRTIPPPAEPLPEPFPFKPSTQKSKPVKTGPPPTPSRFFKGKFTDSDYESDFESIKIPSKWKPYASDTDEPKYRHVNPPRTSPMPRSRSTEKEPLPPSKFEQPAQLSGFARPSINFEACKQMKKETYKKQTSTHFTKSHEVKTTPVPSAPLIKPGSPPIYVKADSPKIKPQSPKTKHKIAQDGYMADTDEPFGARQKKFTKSEYKHEEIKEFSSYQSSQSSQSYQQKLSPVVTPKFSQQKKHVATSSSAKKKLVSTPIVSSVSTRERFEEKKEVLEPFPFKPEPPTTRVKLPPPPSPSKFVKGEFKESDYESDYEGRIPPLWGTGGDKHYRPVRVVLTPTSRHSQSKDRTPTPPTEFDDPGRVSMPTRPKFEPIEKPQKSVKLDQIIKPVPKPTPIFRPKPIMQAAPITDIIIATPAVIKPGSPPKMAYAPGPKRTQYYNSTTSTPYHNAVQTETSNVVHFNESTENAHRTMSVQQTTKVIKFGDKSQKLEPFPFVASPGRPRQSSVPPPPKPSKFVPGEFRESDYESEVESVRIKPKWSPRNDGGDLHYRKVRAPAVNRSSSVPAGGERVVTPMEFDTQPPYQPQISKESKSSQLISKSYENNVKAGHQVDYSYAPARVTKSTATKIASHHMDNMTKSFKSKAQQFVNDIMDDVNNKSTSQKPILKSKDDSDAQVYREETRASQFGTKHVDPDTGLIYFKYDFGYEFGVILPGESKNGEIPMPKKTIIQPPQRSASIEMPVYHERTKTNAPPTQFQPKKISTNKNVKWEPNSESEMSENEADGKRRWEQSSCSPVSVSPSIPSVSPAFHTSSGPTLKGVETPPSCPSTPGVYQNAATKRAPIFITPLRDIAVVSGQTARFECIVQSEPTPTILWSKNGRIIENSYDYQLFFRNGVCRLTIPKAYPEDAGTYTCTATNPTGAVNSTATLQVPGERRSSYI